VLQEIRKARGLTQKELAARCGMTQQLIAHYESNGIDRIPVPTLRKLARTLKVKQSVLTAQSLEDVLQCINGSDARELVHTPAGRQLLAWIAHSRLDAGDEQMAEAIVLTVNIEEVIRGASHQEPEPVGT
jgi:transcriptional regulator with XRE-family HTH domain